MAAMVARLTSEPAALDAESEPPAGTDLSVEPVERVAGTDLTAPRGAAHARLRQLRLRIRVLALEAALARARRRRSLVVEHYERVLEQAEAEDSPEFSWRG